VPKPGSHAYDVQKQRLRKELEDQGVDDDTAEQVADEATRRKAASGDPQVRPLLPPEASPSANPAGVKLHKPDGSLTSAGEQAREELSEMTSITVTDMGPDRFGVEVEEGQLRTGHLVTVSDAVVEEFGLGDVDRDLLVRESVAFLLDREPATSIGEQLSLEEVADRYPDYLEELRARLGAV
jgi:hypothetical protein